MKKLFSEILNRVNTRRMMENTDKLTQIELGQTFEHYRRAAEFAAGLVGQAGIGNCEVIDFPADGKTVYQDKRMPMAWSATRGRLTIIKSGVPFEDQVVADRKRRDRDEDSRRQMLPSHTQQRHRRQTELHGLNHRQAKAFMLAHA